MEHKYSRSINEKNPMLILLTLYKFSELRKKDKKLCFDYQIIFVYEKCILCTWSHEFKIIGGYLGDLYLSNMFKIIFKQNCFLYPTNNPAIRL